MAHRSDRNAEGLGAENGSARESQVQFREATDGRILTELGHATRDALTASESSLGSSRSTTLVTMGTQSNKRLLSSRPRQMPETKDPLHFYKYR